jgi:hypothetical protein
MPNDELLIALHKKLQNIVGWLCFTHLETTPQQMERPFYNQTDSVFTHHRNKNPQDFCGFSVLSLQPLSQSSAAIGSNITNAKDVSPYFHQAALS